MRLFIGIAVPPPARDVLARFAADLPPSYTCLAEPPERMHLTLAFLGQREQQSLPGLETILRETAAESAPFTLIADGLACFAKAGVLFASFSHCAALETLAARLRERLLLAGETFDPKPFVPHVTLARKVREGTPPRTIATCFPQSFPAEALTLFHSTRVDEGLCYLPLAVMPFSALPVP
jgi:RNA 2',3'-cyclic 3'-phosphodiesterase